MLAVEFKKLINQIGIPTSWPDIRSAYRYNAPEEKFRAFEEEVLNYIRQVNSYEGIVNLIVKHEDIFDKELYILRVARLLEADVNMEKSIFANQSDTSRIRLENRNANKQQALQIAKRALKKVAEDAREKGYKKMGLNVFLHNKISYPMYLKDGYKIIEEIDGNEIMEKEL